MSAVGVYVGDTLGAYGFPHGHPFGPDRMDAFWRAAVREGLHERVQRREPTQAAQEAVERFHTPAYVERVKALSEKGRGLLDHGDTPAFAGCYEAAAFVVGSTLDALAQVMEGKLRGAFVPIAGLHHARRGMAGGFCIFNDCGVVIETLRSLYGVRRVAYVDIDAHHGDGVFYGFEEDPEVFVADIHEDGRYLYPGTGFARETGKGEAEGTKLNIPMSPGDRDEEFYDAWRRVETFLEEARPEFVILQAGADSVAGDPLTHLAYSPAAHAHAAQRLVELAQRHCHGRILAVGGGGYNRDNLAAAWTAVVGELLRG